MGHLEDNHARYCMNSQGVRYVFGIDYNEIVLRFCHFELAFLLLFLFWLLEAKPVLTQSWRASNLRTSTTLYCIVPLCS